MVLSKLHLVAISESVSMRITRSEAAWAKGMRLLPKTPAMSPAANAVDATTPDVIFITTLPLPVVAKCQNALRQDTLDEARGASGPWHVRYVEGSGFVRRQVHGQHSPGSRWLRHAVPPDLAPLARA